MEEKISLKLVDLYAQQFAKRVSDTFFAGKNKISGPEILTLCPIKQVNLFIVRDLLKIWKNESSKLHSPYFDYTAPAVKEALSQFQNTLSNHILIERNDFTPLLTHAAAQALYLILDPYDFYSDTLDRSGENKIHVSDLKNEVKYVKINRAPLEKLVERLEKDQRPIVTGNEAFAILDQILEEVNFTPEEIELHLNSFNQVLPVKIDDFYELKETKTEAFAKTPEPSTTPTPTVIPAVKEIKTTLADDLAKKKIKRLKESLTINQKFMFTKILFHGDFEIFSDAIDKIDRQDSFLQAMKFLDENYPHWDRESEEYLEFMEIVENRFS